jgi:hypothetical protein
MKNSAVALQWRLLAWGLLAAGIGFILLRSVIAPRPEIDFRFFWFAGYMWGHGLDPYSADYGTLSREILPAGNKTPAWVYPPHWWAICRLLALFGLDQAVAIWRLLSGAMLIGGTWVMAKALFAGRGQFTTVVAAGSAGLVCLIEPTTMMLALGQNGAFVHLGLCLLVAGHVRSSLLLKTLALLLLSLKPHIGVPVILGLALVPSYRLPIVLATVAGLLLALPQLIPFGPVATFQNLLGSLAGYSGVGMSPEQNPNIPVSSTGLLNLLGHAFPTLTSLPGYGLGILSSLVAGFAMRGKDEKGQLKWLLALIALLITLLPLHVYDLPVLFIPVLMLLSLRTDLGLMSLATLVLALRPSKIEAMFGVPLYGGGVSAGAIGLSLTLLAITALVMILLMSGRADKPAAAGNR